MGTVVAVVNLLEMVKEESEILDSESLHLPRRSNLNEISEIRASREIDLELSASDDYRPSRLETEEDTPRERGIGLLNDEPWNTSENSDILSGAEVETLRTLASSATPSPGTNPRRRVPGVHSAIGAGKQGKKEAQPTPDGESDAGSLRSKTPPACKRHQSLCSMPNLPEGALDPDTLRSFSPEKMDQYNRVKQVCFTFSKCNDRCGRI